MFDLDRAVAEWRQEMTAGGVKSSKVLDELEGHLREDIGTLVSDGMPENKAFRLAASRLGDAETVSKEFKKAERASPARLVKRLLFCVVVGIFAIATFGYLVIVPLAERANAHYAASLGISKPQAVVGFVWRFVLAICLGLAMPVAMVALVRTGVFNQRRLASLRPYAILANFILAALLTTPEAVTQILLFVPLQLLCEVGILVAGIWERRGQKPA